MPADQELANFIGSTFRSVWTLELALLMSGEADRGWTRDELVSALRASELIVSRSIEELMAAGLVVTDSADRACFRPASPKLSRSIDQVRALYARKPDKVRRIIVAGSTGGLAAFADAFRIRKD